MFKVITRAVIIPLIILCMSIWAVQNYTRIPDKITEMIVSLLRDECKLLLTFKKSKLNLFTCSLHFYNGQATPTNGKKCCWSFEHWKLYISPIKVLFSDPHSLYITLNNVTAKTDCHSTHIDLVDHIKDMFAPSLASMQTLPLSITINNLDITFKTYDQVIKAHLIGRIKALHDTNRQAPYRNRHWFGSISITDGSITGNDKKLVTNIHSLISYYQSNNEKQKINISHATDFHTSLLDPDNRYTLEGEYNSTSKQLRLTDSESRLDVTAKLLSTTKTHITGQIPLQLLTDKANGSCA